MGNGVLGEVEGHKGREEKCSYCHLLPFRCEPCARCFLSEYAPYDMKRILEIRIVEENVEAESWDWIQVCLTSPPSSRLLLGGGGA